MMMRYPPTNDDVFAMLEILEQVREHGSEYAASWGQRAEVLFDAWYRNLDLGTAEPEAERRAGQQQAGGEA